MFVSFSPLLCVFFFVFSHDLRHEIDHVYELLSRCGIRHKKPFLLPSSANFFIQMGRYFTPSNNALYLIRQNFAF